ncbi:MAG: hypothetical protein JXQ73_23240 [Phycisphaerae bacterium]|nr:hypothetical protein [Phycisphaerae bacterium]
MKLLAIKRGVFALIAVAVAAALYLSFGYQTTDVTAPPAKVPRPVSQPNPSKNHQLAMAFIRWFELQYVENMQEVGGMSTDLGDLVNEAGVEATIDAYAAIRRLTLDFAMKNPRQTEIPEQEIDRIAETQYELFVGNMRSSKKWIDYRNPELRAGLIESYRKAARIWIPAYQKLVTVPSSSSDDDFREFFRKHLPRAEYKRAMDSELNGTNLLYASLKHGVAWYGAPMVNRMLNLSCKLDDKIGLDTVEKIYGADSKDDADDPNARR